MHCLRTIVLASVAIAIVSGCGVGDRPTPAESASSASRDEIPAVPASPASQSPLLVDATTSWGVDFTHDSGAGGALLFPEMIGGGIAVFDANNDGDLDLYFVSGAPRLGQSPAADGPSNRLFVQEAGGGFRDATEGSGLGDRGYGTGVAVGDIDNDGFEDVFVSSFGPDRLFRGRGDGTFEDVSTRAGITATGAEDGDWSTSAVFCDFDRDGYLDLYVVRYVVYDSEVTCTDKAGRREYCGPDNYVDRTDVLLQNQGDGTFRDVSESAGITVVTGAGLGVVCEDIDDDGWMDIYVANDGDPNQLWINQSTSLKALGFIDDALIMGASVNSAGLHEAGMGVVAADFDNDTDFDLFLTHLRDETNTFYRNLGSGMGFEDATVKAGLAAASTPYTGFGTAPLDLDLDGDLDLAIVNGRVSRGDALSDELGEPWRYYAEPNLVYRNDGGTFDPLVDRVSAFVDPIEIGRGFATGDLDGDGDLDLVVSNIGSPSRLYRAEPAAAHWLLVDVYDPRLRRRPLGARVTVRAGEKRQVRTVQSAMSYLSASDPRAHFGLGNQHLADVAVTIRWPDGLEEIFEGIAVDQAIVLSRGEGR